jgi:hypothetical protein
MIILQILVFQVTFFFLAMGMMMVPLFYLITMKGFPHSLIPFITMIALVGGLFVGFIIYVVLLSIFIKLGKSERGNIIIWLISHTLILTGQGLIIAIAIFSMNLTPKDPTCNQIFQNKGYKVHIQNDENKSMYIFQEFHLPSRYSSNNLVEDKQVRRQYKLLVNNVGVICFHSKRVGKFNYVFVQKRECEKPQS